MSAWVPIGTIIGPNKLTIASGSQLAVVPQQNDVYAVLNLTPDSFQNLLATSKDSTRIYVQYAPSGKSAFGVGDWIALRTEMQQIIAVGTDSFVTQPYVQVATPFSFVPDEGEQAALIYHTNAGIPAGGAAYYCYYLNKPKVIRIEIHDSLPETTDFWKRIDYEYDYSVQGTSMADTIVDSGFGLDNVEGPNPQSFDASDITIKQTIVTTGISNINEDIDYLREIYTFSYDVKSFHKGHDSVTTMRLENGGTQWLFVKRTVNGLGRPCFNADFYGVMGYTYFEGGDPTQSNGGAPWRKKVDYRFDVYGRKVRERVSSVSLDGKQNRNIFTQYVGSSPYLAAQGTPDLDPLGMFAANYFSGNYQSILSAFHALGLVGGTIEEVDTYGNLKCTFNEFSIYNMNLQASDTVVLSSLNTFLDQYSTNNPNMNGWIGSTEYPQSALSWSLPSYQGGALQSDFSTAVYDDTSMTSHAVTYFTYDPATNNLLTITKPRGNVITLTYGTGYLSSYIATDVTELDQNMNIGGNTTQYVVNAYTYDIKGRLTSKTTRFKTDTLANDTNLVVYGSHNSKSETQYTYDNMDRLLTKSDGNGTTQTEVLANVYNDTGDSTWPGMPYTITTDYLGFRTKKYYDTRYRLIYTRKFKPNQAVSGNLSYPTSYELVISSQQNIWQPGIEKVFQEIQYSNPNESLGLFTVKQYTYDSIGRVLEVDFQNTDPAYQGDSVFHTIKLISYDESVNGVVTQDFVDDGSGDYAQTRVENDWLGRGPMREITWTALSGGGSQRITTYKYRYDGKLTRKQMPNGEYFLYNYDTNGRLEMITYPDGTRWAMMYDLNGNLVQSLDRRNVSVTMAYNQSDLPINKTAIDSVRGNSVVTTVHTQFGPAEITKVENAAQIVQDNLWYHWSGAVLERQQTIDGYTRQIAKGYDLAGNLISVTPTGSGSSPWTYTFDIVPQFLTGNPDTSNFNRTAVVDGSTSDNIITDEPDFYGLTTNIKYGNFASVVSSVAHGYDKFHRLISFVSSETTPFLNVTLTRDFIGKILSHSEPANAPVPAINNTYSYDGMNRLASGEGSSEAYDQLSNLVVQGLASYTYQNIRVAGSDQMRLATFNNGQGTTRSYSYDANGNPTAVANQFTSLSFDNLNMLRQIVYSQTDNYWYQDGGLRVKKTENATGAWTTTYTLFDGDNPLLQEIYTASGLIQTTFNIIVAGRILAQYKMVYPSTLSVVYFYLDNLFSRRVVVNTADGANDRIRYSAWGVATQDVGSDNIRSFTGKDYDATGLIYFNARYYDPTTGRFLTEDPSRKGINWYAYCENNPINKMDPTGHAGGPSEDLMPPGNVTTRGPGVESYQRERPDIPGGERYHPNEMEDGAPGFNPIFRDVARGVAKLWNQIFGKSEPSPTLSPKDLRVMADVLNQSALPTPQKPSLQSSGPIAPLTLSEEKTKP